MSGEAYTGVDNLDVMAAAVNYNQYLLAIVERQLKPDSKVLDFGAGSGTFALPLLARGVDVMCVEPDPVLSARLREASAPTIGSLKDVGRALFDVAYAFNVLEHIEDDRAALASLATVLRPRGRLVVYVPAFPVLFTAMDRKVHHFRRYRREPLVQAISSAGLRITEAAYADSLGFPATLLYRFFGDSGGDINQTTLQVYDRWLFPLSRIVDRASGKWFGKNLLVIAEKPSS